MNFRKNKWLYIVFAGILVFIVVIIYVNIFIFNTHTTAIKKLMLEQLESLSRAKSSEISAWDKNYKKSIDYFKRTSYFDNINLDEIKNNKGSKSLESINKSLTLLYQYGFVNGFMIIDTNQNVLYKDSKIRSNLSNINLTPNTKILVTKLNQNFKIENLSYIRKAKKNKNTVFFTFENKLFDTNIEVINYKFYLYVVTPITKKVDLGYKLLGYFIFSIDVEKNLSIILKPLYSGNNIFNYELINTYNYEPNKVVRIYSNKMGKYVIEYGKSNLPVFYLPKQYQEENLYKSYFEGYDRDGEYILAKLSKNSNTFFLLTKINLKEYYEYRKIFVLYLTFFSSLIISGIFLLFYLFQGYYKNLNYKKEYELLIQRQAYQVRYETLLKNANDAIVLYDKTGQIFEYNSKFAKVFGLDGEHLTNINIAKIWDARNFETEKDLILNTELMEGKVFESYNVDKNKNIFPVEVSIRSVKIENTTFNQAIIRDISERKMHEIELTESKEKYKNLVENINDVLFTIDTKGTIKYISPVIVNVTGYTEEEIINRNIFDFLNSTEKDKVIEIKRALLAEEVNNSTLSLSKKNGQLCYVKVSLRLNKIKDGDIIITGILTDITYEKELELMLEKERLDLKTIIELSPVAIFFKDKYNNYIKVNKAASLISNFEIEEIEGKSAKEIFPNSHDIYYKEDVEIMSSGIPKFGITEKLEINGREIWLRSDKVPWYNERGEVSGIICFSVDITDQVKAESALIKEKELLQWILRTIPVGLLYINKEGAIILGNDAAEKIFGLSFNIDKIFYYSPELELYELDWAKVKAEKNPFNISSLENQLTKNRELIFYKKDGSEIILSINTSLINDISGNIEGVVASIEDITERKGYEKALKESELRYRSLFESMQEGFGLHEIICDDNGKPVDYRFLEVNPSFERLTELKANEIINKTAKQIFPDLEEFWIEQYGKIALNPSYVEFENYSGSLGRYYKVSAFSIVKGIFAVLFEDITEKKKIEQELEQHRQKLELMVKVRTQELNRTNIMLSQEIEKGKGTEMMLKRTLEEVQKFSDLKTRFISTASHEFRTPLTTISTSIQLLRDYGRKWDDTKYFQHIDRIVKTIDNLTELINDVLLVSKVESGKIEFKPCLENLNAFCYKLVEEFKNDFAKNHIIDYNYKAEKNEYYFDTKLLRSIITNLLTNAVKYSSFGEVITINVENDERFIRIFIIDNGIGISEEDLEHLFEPFHRGNNVADISGTGLGMSIIKRYIEIHKGNVEVKSKLNKGTTVKLNLPILLPEINKNESINN